ncbi:hypothetical protein ECANGB1_2410 [Enterospora canceri]|uniref:Sm domain-containing protein n=1 Tax=Enterospora canceri TaxID=1081671 RepID=A0A1Y1S4P6_9MICR|nr:hypothetical protein ECANGB1_2410 [Enterospora canceri]
MDNNSTEFIMRDLMNKRVKILNSNNAEISGVLKSVDGYLNCVLEDAEFKGMRMKDAFVRGMQVKSIFRDKGDVE